MTRNLFMLFAVAFLFLLSLTAYNLYSNKYKSKLEDLGGVYSSTGKSIDFDFEVSGRLTEDDLQSLDEENEKSIAENSKDGLAGNKLLRWGISRRQNNMIPAADPGAPELLAKYGAAYIGDTSQKKVYLTFDEGYENGFTSLILDVLRDNGVKAIFFITGPYLKEHQDLVMRMVEEGHEVGNHTIHHPCLPELDSLTLEEEVLGLDRAFSEKFNTHMRFLRPPKGEYSERMLELTYKLGYCNLFWSFAYDDWYKDKQRGADYAHSIVIRNIHNGAVLLLHAVSKDNANALNSIIKSLQEMGYSFGAPDELLNPGGRMQ